MATTNLNIRTDKAIKDQAEEIFNELGLNMTTAVNMFLRTAIRDHGIPFELKLDVPNETTAAAIGSSGSCCSPASAATATDLAAAATKFLSISEGRLPTEPVFNGYISPPAGT